MLNKLLFYRSMNSMPRRTLAKEQVPRNIQRKNRSLKRREKIRKKKRIHRFEFFIIDIEVAACMQYVFQSNTPMVLQVTRGDELNVVQEEKEEES